MTDKVKYVLLRNVANYTEGDIVEFDVLPTGLQAHVKEYKGDKKPEAKVDVKAVKAEATAEAREVMANLYNTILGKKPGNAGLDKMASDIEEAFKAKETPKE